MSPGRVYRAAFDREKPRQVRLRSGLIRSPAMVKKVDKHYSVIAIMMYHGMVGSVFLRFLALSRFVSSSCHSPSRVDSLHCFISITQV
jgi:hypothetical protein